MEDRTIEVRDHRIYLRAGDAYVSYTPFTTPDSLEDFREPLIKLGFDVADKIEIVDGNERLNGFKIKRPTSLGLSRLIGERLGLLYLQTSRYKGSREVLEEVVEGLGLITDFPSEKLLSRIKRCGSYYLKQSESTKEVCLRSKRSSEESFGALSYASFLVNAKKVDAMEAIEMAGREYGFNLKEVLTSMKS